MYIVSHKINNRANWVWDCELFLLTLLMVSLAYALIVEIVKLWFKSLDYRHFQIFKNSKRGEVLTRGPENFCAAPGIVDKQDGVKGRRFFAQ